MYEIIEVDEEFKLASVNEVYSVNVISAWVKKFTIAYCKRLQLVDNCLIKISSSIFDPEEVYFILNRPMSDIDDLISQNYR